MSNRFHLVVYLEALVVKRDRNDEVRERMKWIHLSDCYKGEKNVFIEIYGVLKKRRPVIDFSFDLRFVPLEYLNLLSGTMIGQNQVLTIFQCQLAA